MDEETTTAIRRKEQQALSPEERMTRFMALQKASMAMMSPEGIEHFHRRNHGIRRMHFENGQWTRA